ncbi:MAG: hypothetical protein RBR86_04300 [Pseudobdellovibrionaceae bacterium]|jgi:acetoin utilization deacetylase AcuC-like enzyme|nr:hypothetical protein [Pseudobdellovibrionaceae bacterium]
MSGGISMVTRVERIAMPFGESYQNTDLNKFDKAFERRLSWIEQKFPVKKAEDLSWSGEENEYFARMGRVLSMIGTDDEASGAKISRKSVLPALKGVKSACQAVDDIISGKANQVVCATRLKSEERDYHDDAIGYTIFGNAALAAQYALAKNSISRVAIVDFDVDHGQDLVNMVSRNQDILLISAALGPSLSEFAKDAPNCQQVRFPKICHSKDIERIFAESIESRLEQFRPDLIILSLRPNAHENDSLHPVGGKYVNEKIFSYAKKFSKSRYICILEGQVDIQQAESYKLD